MNYQFSIIIQDISFDIPHLEDMVFNAGCSDALIYQKNQQVQLEFDREAINELDAINSAIRQLEKASFKNLQVKLYKY